MCNCTKCGWPVFTKYKKSFPCPRCETLIECDGISRPEANAEGEPLATARYNHWAPLHWYAVEHADNWNEAKAKAFYRNWKKNIPNTAGCGCQAKWKKLGMVPDYSSPQAFFEWAWTAHDTVSERLISEGKQAKRLTLEEAYSVWGFNDLPQR